VVWCGVVWCGVVWCGVVWCGVVWCGQALRRQCRSAFRYRGPPPTIYSHHSLQSSYLDRTADISRALGCELNETTRPSGESEFQPPRQKRMQPLRSKEQPTCKRILVSLPRTSNGTLSAGAEGIARHAHSLILVITWRWGYRKDFKSG
jgi:hypothetical protein